jgi:hypothetical protein
MAANTSPIFILSSCLGYVQATTANTARDGSGTVATLLTGDADGSIVDLIRIVATGTTTAGVVRIFLSTDSGTTKRLLCENLVAAITPGTTQTVFTTEFIPTRPLVLKDTSSILYASTQIGETFNIFAYGGNY